MYLQESQSGSELRFGTDGKWLINFIWPPTMVRGAPFPVGTTKYIVGPCLVAAKLGPAVKHGYDLRVLSPYKIVLIW